MCCIISIVFNFIFTKSLITGFIILIRSGVKQFQLSDGKPVQQSVLKIDSCKVNHFDFK
jgi:hypothetical protein